MRISTVPHGRAGRREGVPRALVASSAAHPEAPKAPVLVCATVRPWPALAGETPLWRMRRYVRGSPHSVGHSTDSVRPKAVKAEAWKLPLRTPPQPARHDQERRIRSWCRSGAVRRPSGQSNEACPDAVRRPDGGKFPRYDHRPIASPPRRAPRVSRVTSASRPRCRRSKGRAVARRARRDIGATACIGERVRDRHLAAQRGICRLELDHFDNLLVRYELHEAAVERVRVRSRLAGPSGCGVRERDPERATFAGVERMHVAGHAGRHHPRRDRARIEKRAIDERGGRIHAATDAGRVHNPTLAPAARRATRRPGGPFDSACTVARVFAHGEHVRPRGKRGAKAALGRLLPHDGASPLSTLNSHTLDSRADGRASHQWVAATTANLEQTQDWRASE